MRAAYERWHEVLSGEFFGADHALRSTVLYVDDDVERELAQRHGIDVSLIQAVADELNWNAPERALLWRVQSQCADWERRGLNGAPPSLPVLALSVLAATRMASSDGMLRTNYYGRWGELFGELPTGYRGKRLERAFEVVAAMWEQLDSWMEDTGGLYGMSTISTDGHYWRIGYPISQALVRGSDRQILTRFFATTRLRPKNPNGVPGRELLRRLRVWTAGRERRLSPRLMVELEQAAGFVSEGGGEPLIVGILERLAGDWDGTLHEAELGKRRRALGLRLALTDRGRNLEWIAETTGGISETHVRIPEGRTFRLSTGYGGVYSGLDSLHPSEQQLRQGIRLEGDDLVLEWAPQEVVLLRMHPKLGEWVSAEYFEPGEQHWILAAESALSEVRSMVNALEGRTAREASASVPGWKIFKGVRAINSKAFTRALDKGGEHAHVLEPQVRQTTKLAGGLRIAREYRAGGGVAGHYLRGGEPDLLLPASSSPDGMVEVVLDRYTEKLRADPRVPFPLRALIFDEGEHRVGTALSSEVFTVHDGLHEGLPDGTGAFGYICDGPAALEVSAVDGSNVGVRGAEIPPGLRLPRTVMVRCSTEEAFVIDPWGGVQAVEGQSMPAWMASRLPAEACTASLEVEIPDGYVWLIYRTAIRWSVRALVEAAEMPEPSPAAADFQWAYPVLRAADRCTVPAWLDYVAAAQEIAGRRGTA